MAIIIPAIVLLTSWIVMLLWNSILPVVLPVKSITFLQATGILILSKILFGGFRSFPWRYRRPGYPSDIRAKWMIMSAEEKEKFREEWKKRCGH